MNSRSRTLALLSVGLATACSEGGRQALTDGGSQDAMAALDTSRVRPDSTADGSAPLPDAVRPPEGDAGVLPTDTGTDTGTAGVLVLNEATPAPVDGDDWFEVYASGGPVDLADYTVVDDDDDHSPASLPARILPAGGLLRVFAARDAPTDASPWVPFKLGAADSLTLRRAGVIMDEVTWSDGDAPSSASRGRLPDGTGAWALTRPTPGTPNEAFPGELPPESPFVADRVAEVRLELSPGAWAAMTADPLAEAWHDGDLVWDTRHLTGVKIRVKGNSSLNSVVRMGSHRYSFKVDTDDVVAGQSLLGEKKLNLNNGFKDPTLLRETLGYELLRSLGVPAPRTAFVDLWVAGEHMGLYTLVEEVDGDFLDEHFTDGGGDLYKPEPPAGSLSYLGDTPEDYRGLETQRNEDTTDHAAFLALVGALRQGDAAAFPAVLDVDQSLRYLAANALLVNLDSYLGTGHNYYLYEQAGVFTVIPWDLNEAFANFTCGCDAASLIDFRIDEPVCGALAERPLAAALLAVPEHLEAYHGHLRTLLDGPFSEAAVRARVEALAALVRPYVEVDPTRFFSLADFDRGLSEDVGTGQGQVFGLVSFARLRGERVRAQLAGERPSTDGGRGGCRGNAGPGPEEFPCGDGVCDQAEQANANLCPRDCREAPPGGWCGDALCDAFERQELACPEDCAG